MTILKFKGVVEWYPYEFPYGEFLIGGRNVIREILEAEDKGQFANKVTVAIADQRFTGDLYALPGLEGYSEWTPGEPAELMLGAHNLLDIIKRYDGQEVTLWIADEPINTLEDDNE